MAENGKMKRILLSLFMASFAALASCAQPQGTVYEPVRYEDGTPVSDDPEAEALFAQDRFLTDTTVSERGDTLLIVRHASAYVRIELDGLPADAGIGEILLVPLEGGIQTLPMPLPESGAFSMWMAKDPGSLPAAAAIARASDGRSWSVRLKGLDLRAGTAYRWTGTFLPPDTPATDFRATPLPASILDIEPGEYSGITHISGNRYAVVHDKLKGGGIVFFSIPLGPDGTVTSVLMKQADGTAEAGGKARDCEGIAFVPSTATLYVSTESQDIREYDLAGRETGKRLRIPEGFSSKDIDANRGFEALTYDDSAERFWTTTESPLKKDTFLPRILRLQSFGSDGEPGEQFLYQTGEPVRSSAGSTAYVHGVPALAALGDGRLIVLEREVYVPKGGFWDKLANSFTQTDLYLVDPVHDTAGILRKSLLCSFRTGALDLANFEGMCLGPTLPDGRRTLVLIADSQKGSGGLTNEYVKVILLQ